MQSVGVDPGFGTAGRRTGSVEGVSGPRSQRAELARTAMEPDLQLPVSSLTSELGIKSGLRLTLWFSLEDFVGFAFNLALRRFQQRF